MGTETQEPRTPSGPNRMPVRERPIRLITPDDDAVVPTSIRPPPALILIRGGKQE